jgi:pentose-5-phosphate-3-epimerase
MITIIPSIASADQLRIGEEIKKAEAAGRLHLDIEDGNFSPGITFGLDLIEQIVFHRIAILDKVLHPQHNIYKR